MILMSPRKELPQFDLDQFLIAHLLFNIDGHSPGNIKDNSSNICYCAGKACLGWFQLPLNVRIQPEEV